MPRRARADFAALDAVASAQRGLVTTAQLHALGLPSSTIHERIRAGGPWTRLLPATYLTSRARPDRSQQREAVRLYAGPGCVITAADALELHGVRRPRATEDWPVHVLIDHALRRASVGCALVERTRRLPDAVWLEGVPVAPVERAVVDLCRRLQSRGDVTAVVARAVQQSGASIDRLEEEVASAPIRHTSLVREAVAAIGAGVASAPEAELRRLWLGSQLPTPLWNPDLFDRTGAFIARPDAYLPDVALAVEVESREFHFESADWLRTMERQARMTARGITVLPYPPSALRERPDQLLAQIDATRRGLVGRQLPDLVVRPRRVA